MSVATKTKTEPESTVKAEEPVGPAVPPMGQPIEVVFATTNITAQLASGVTVTVPGGTHWPSTDPVVAKYPAAFSSDVRYGLLFSEPPPGYGPDLVPLEAEVVS